MNLIYNDNRHVSENYISQDKLSKQIPQSLNTLYKMYSQIMSINFKVGEEKKQEKEINISNKFGHLVKIGVTSPESQDWSDQVKELRSE